MSSTDTQANPSQGVTRTWRWVFALEIPLTGGAIAYWVSAPGHYLGTTLGMESLNSGHTFLLMSYAATVFSMVVYLYARLLMQMVIELRSFRHYQEALLVGDVLLVSAFIWGIVNGIVPADKAAPAIGMATLWGSIRGWFLVRVR